MEDQKEITESITSENLRKHRGMIIFSREFLTQNASEETLKEIFSNFFPMAMESDHSFSMYEKIRMYGYSPHFREIEETERCPEYEMRMTFDSQGGKFEKMIEIIK